MANGNGILEQLEQAASRQETLIEKAARSAATNIATGGMASAFAAPGVGEALAGAGGSSVSLHGAQIADGSVLHHGPEIGGEALERPSAGYLADSARSSGVAVEHSAGTNVSSIARSVDDAGHLSMNGAEYDVFDYLPGGDALQIAAGRVDPAQVMGSMAGEGIEHGMMFEAERGFKDVKSDRNRSSTQGKSSGGAGADDEVEGPHAHKQGHAVTAQGAVPGIEGAARSAGTEGEPVDDTASGSKRRIDPATGRHIPDADENARDLEELMFEHHQRLDTAVEGSNQSTVHTELHAHGRTLEIDTEFEAHDRKDVPKEIREADDHAEKALHAPQGIGSTVESDNDDMRFRSQVHAHLDAASRDEGMSI